MKSYRQGSHSLFDLKVHVVWITKYRKPVLSGNVRLDHVHSLVSIPPKLRVSKLMQRLKGVSSRRLLQSNKKLQKEFWGKHLWARGYFAVSSGNVTDEVIAEYIKNQDEIERRVKSDNFTVGF